MRYQILAFIAVLPITNACVTDDVYPREREWRTYQQAESDRDESVAVYDQSESSRATMPFRSATPVKRREPISIDGVVSVARASDAETAIQELDQTPFAFELNQNSLAQLHSQKLDANVMQYLELRAAIQWQAPSPAAYQYQSPASRGPAPAPVSPSYASSATQQLPRSTNPGLTEVDEPQIVANPRGAVATVAPAASQQNGQFAYVVDDQPQVVYESYNRAPVVVYTAPRIGWVNPYYRSGYYCYPGYGGRRYYRNRPYVRSRHRYAPRVSRSQIRPRRYRSGGYVTTRRPQRRVVRNPVVRSRPVVRSGGRRVSGPRRGFRSSRGTRRR